MAPSESRSYANSTGRFSTRTLEGAWTATPANDDSRRAVLSRDTDSLTWHSVTVPGEWRSHSAFADHAGAVLYRLRLTHARPVDDERTWIVSDGILDQADIWLDSAYVGDQDDYFLRHSYDVTELCALDDDHELVVEVNGAHHAGIRGPLTLKTTGRVAIDRVRVLCRDASDVRAHLRLSAELDANTSARVVVRTRVDDSVVSERPMSVTPGKNRIEWTADIANPRLWWPAALGEQPMSEIVVEVETDAVVSDRHTTSVGLREVSMTNWILHVNGERLYLKGAYIDLPDVDLGTLSDDAASQPIRTARDLGLDLVRVRHHVAHPALYDAADRTGTLIWQDIPHRPRGARGRRMASRWAHGLVTQLGHHPSIALWHHDGLDRTAHRVLTTADETRPVVSHAGTVVSRGARAASRFTGTSNLLAGIGLDLDASLQVIPNLGRFPIDEEWQLIRERSNDFASAVAMRRDIETLRRIKYAPSGGFCFPGLRDESFLSTGSALDASNMAQPGYYTLEDACRPVIIVGAGLPPTVSPNQELSMMLHVVSDLRIPLAESRVVATVSHRDDDGEREIATHEWHGDVEPDAVTFISMLHVMAPSTVGRLIVDLQVECGDHTASNSYVASIVD